MNINFKRIVQSTLAVALTLGVVGAQARPTHWMDQDDDRIRNGEIVDLGDVVIGNSNYHVDADTLNLFNNPRIQCRLTHLKLSAYSDSVVITRIDVEYRDADHDGKYRDSIDLYDQGHGHGHGNGIYLDNGKSTGWLDVDDVVDGHADGRCIKSIRVYGIDTPDHTGYNGGYDDGYDHGYPEYGYADGYDHGHWHDGDNFRPAHVRVQGLVTRSHHDEPSHHEPSHSHHFKYDYLGTTGLVQKFIPESRVINVGRSQGRFDGVKLIAKDDAFEIRSMEVVFANGQRLRQENLNLMEGQEIYIDFDDFHHDHEDRDRFIDQIVIFGDAANPFGSKAQIEVYGGR